MLLGVRGISSVVVEFLGRLIVGRSKIMTLLLSSIFCASFGILILRRDTSWLSFESSVNYLRRVTVKPLGQ